MESKLYESFFEEGLRIAREEARIAAVELSGQILEQKIGLPLPEKHRQMLTQCNIKELHQLIFELSLVNTPAKAREAIEKLDAETSES